jgi:hypothetical protein
VIRVLAVTLAAALEKALTSSACCLQGVAGAEETVNRPSAVERRRSVPDTRVVGARVPEWLEADARRAASELAGVDVSTLVRAALAKLADPNLSVGEALAKVRTRPGPKPKARLPV